MDRPLKKLDSIISSYQTLNWTKFHCNIIRNGLRYIELFFGSVVYIGHMANYVPIIKEIWCYDFYLYKTIKEILLHHHNMT